MDNFVVHRPVEPSLEIRPERLVVMSAAAPATAPVRHPSLPEGCLAAAVVDLDAVAANVAALREHATGAQLMAVVKADGYGHGMVPVARAALAGGADRLGVAHLREALELRAAGIDAPVLAWLTVPGDAYPAAVAAGVEIGVSATSALAEVAAAARAVGRTARVHLKADTGLSRNGCPPDAWDELVGAAAQLAAEGAVETVGVFSHLACADEPEHPSVRAQHEAFAVALAAAERAGLVVELRHLANSAATVLDPAARFDLVRPGIAVYGLSPAPARVGAAELGLRPAMTLLARVAMAKRVPAGAGVSYGHTYLTPAETTLALLPVGYGDGLPRQASGAGPVLLGGRRLTVAGRVCMDQIVVDAGAVDERAGVAVGDVAVVFGDAAAGEPTATDWADAAGTIDYEIVTRIGARVPRLHIGTAGVPAPTEGTAPAGRQDGRVDGGGTS
jgi:alanine racemase